MLIRLVLSLVLAAVASIAAWFLFESTYSADAFASEEARTSLEVTEAQTAELRASAQKSDMIVFGLLGAIIAGLAGSLSNPLAAGPKGRLIGAAAGFVLGAVGGAVAAWIGHAYDANVAFPTDPMLYWFGRWGLMLLPIALTAAVAAAASGAFGRVIGEAIVAALIGAAVATFTYVLLAGMVTPIEPHHYIYPGMPANRLMICLVSSLGIVGSLTALLGRGKVGKADKTANNPPENSETATH